MSTNGERKPRGLLDPEAVREASAFTFKELRAKLGKLRLVESMERMVADTGVPKPIPRVPQRPPESLDPS